MTCHVLLHRLLFLPLLLSILTILRELPIEMAGLKLRVKKASNNRYTFLSGARSYQHKAVGELHRQKGSMSSFVQYSHVFTESASPLLIACAVHFFAPFAC